MGRVVLILACSLILLSGAPAWFLIIIVPLLFGVAAPLILMGGVIGVALTFRREPHPLRALIVDDDEISIIPLITAMSSRPLRITLAKNGTEMLTTLEREEFDLIILDKKMEKMDGDQALSWGDLRLHLKRPVPVIYYTASDEPILRNTYRNFSILAVWRKNVSYEALVQKIDFVLKPTLFA